MARFSVILVLIFTIYVLLIFRISVSFLVMCFYNFLFTYLFKYYYLRLVQFWFCWRLLKLQIELSGICGEMAEFSRATERNEVVCDEKILFYCAVRCKFMLSLPVMCRPHGEFQKYWVNCL